MAMYGYARVSSTDQDLRVQRAALKAAGCEANPRKKRAERDVTAARNCKCCSNFCVLATSCW